MSNFTPGTWMAETEYECAVYAHDRQMKIADIRGWGFLTGQGHGGLGLSPTEASKIQNANARLIAAAPEMVTLLNAALCEMQNPYAEKWITSGTRMVANSIAALLRRIEGEEEAQ